jgi:hypothetical protein
MKDAIPRFRDWKRTPASTVRSVTYPECLIGVRAHTRRPAARGRRIIIESMRARIADIPPEQEATWGAVLAVLRFDNRPDWKMQWVEHHPRGAKPFSTVDVEVAGQDVDALRAEIAEAVDIVNDIVRRDPLHLMVRADIGLVEVFIK